MALARFETHDESSDCTPEAVRAELARVLESAEFSATPRRRKLLEYLVEEMLAGRGSAIKGYTIGVNVLGRGEDFDPDADPSVRLEARSLRRDLDSYYVEAGRANPLRISIPKGHYIPAVTVQDAVASVPEESKQSADARHELAWRLLAALAFLTIVPGVAYYLLAGGGTTATGSGQQGPVVVVQPFNSSGSDRESRDFATGLTADLINNLMQFPSFRLYALQPDLHWLNPPEPPKPGVATYLVSGDVLMDGTEIAVHTQLMDAATGAVLWSKNNRKPLVPEVLIGMQRELAGDLAAEIGQPYGAVYSDLYTRQKSANVTDMQSYICVLRAFDYRRSGFSAEKYVPVLQCLETAVVRDPDYADAWAMLGWLYMDGGRFDITPGSLEDQYEKALQTASRAIELDPDNVLAISALSAINHYLGHFEESIRLARRALELNPNDSDVIAQLGWRLWVRGNFEEGVPLVKRAIARTQNPPAWYYPTVAIDDYLKGNFQDMLEQSKQFSANGTALNHTLVAIANAELGNREAARSAFAKISPNSLLLRDPVSFFGRHRAVDQITLPIVAALEKTQKLVSKQ
jgi:tetratricopeptide (TPR) repeat protein/TolB-like protein